MDTENSSEPTEQERAIRNLKASATRTHKAIAMVAIHKMKLEQARQDAKTMDLSAASTTISEASKRYRNAEAQLEQAVASEVQANIVLINRDLTKSLEAIKIDTVIERQEGSDAGAEQPAQSNEGQFLPGTD